LPGTRVEFEPTIGGNLQKGNGFRAQRVRVNDSTVR